GIFRTAANGAQFRLLTFLNNNTATTFTDNTTDANRINFAAPAAVTRPPVGTAPHADSRALVFDPSGRLMEGDDGGIFRLVNPGGGAPRFWESLIGDLQITEVGHVAYDPINQVLTIGTQDTGNQEQAGPNALEWRSVSLGDGAFQAVGIE